MILFPSLVANVELQQPKELSQPDGVLETVEGTLTKMEQNDPATSAPCPVCHDLSKEVEPYQLVLLLATLEALYDRKADCTTCLLLFQAALTRNETWTDGDMRKIMVEVRTTHTVTSQTRGLSLRVYEILKPCPNETQWQSPEYSKYLFGMVLYSPSRNPNSSQLSGRRLITQGKARAQLSPALPSVFKLIPSLPHISPDPLSPSARESVSEWLQACMANHLDCKPPPEGSRILPRRLVDVGTTDDSVIRLVSAAQDHKYLTLSHCWGPEKPLVTTKATEQTLRTKIKWEALPLSFQHAIQVTRWLGQRYIWIDSMCIVQDDSCEWDEESAKMADIYSGCELAIAASRAASCRDGFLQDRTGGYHVLSQEYHGRRLSVFARVESHSSSRGGIPEPFYELPLFQRGWCFQERLLAPRVLHFARHELYLQCRTEERCECGGRGAWKHSLNPFSAGYSMALSPSSRMIGGDRTRGGTEWQKTPILAVSQQGRSGVPWRSSREFTVMAIYPPDFMDAFRGGLVT